VAARAGTSLAGSACPAAALAASEASGPASAGTARRAALTAASPRTTARGTAALTASLAAAPCRTHLRHFLAEVVLVEAEGRSCRGRVADARHRFVRHREHVGPVGDGDGDLGVHTRL